MPTKAKPASQASVKALKAALNRGLDEIARRTTKWGQSNRGVLDDVRKNLEGLAKQVMAQDKTIDEFKAKVPIMIQEEFSKLPSLDKAIEGLKAELLKMIQDEFSKLPAPEPSSPGAATNQKDFKWNRKVLGGIAAGVAIVATVITLAIRPPSKGAELTTTTESSKELAAMKNELTRLSAELESAKAVTWHPRMAPAEETLQVSTKAKPDEALTASIKTLSDRLDKVAEAVFDRIDGRQAVKPTGEASGPPVPVSAPNQVQGHANNVDRNANLSRDDLRDAVQETILPLMRQLQRQSLQVEEERYVQYPAQYYPPPVYWPPPQYYQTGFSNQFFGGLGNGLGYAWGLRLAPHFTGGGWGFGHGHGRH